MGDAGSKAQCTIAESPSGSGLKSVVSAPLDESAALTPEKFWQLYEKQSRAGLTLSTLTTMLSGAKVNHQCRDLEGGGFEVEDAVEGGWTGIGGGSKVLLRHFCDKEKQEWYTRMYKNSFTDEELTETITTKLLTDPMRVEAWSDVVASRSAGSDLQGFLQALLGNAMKRAGAKNASPSCVADAESLDGSGKKCVLSEVLDESVTFDKLWDLYIALIKEGFEKPKKTDHKVEELPDGSFVIVDSFEGGHVVYEKFTLDKEKGTIVSHTHENDQKLSDESHVDTYTTLIHKDPLRVAFWRETVTGRKASCNLLTIIQDSIDTCIKDAAESSWF